MATYAYFIDNTKRSETVDNSTIFQYIHELQLPEDNIIAENAGERTEIKNLFNQLIREDILIIRSIADLGDSITHILRVLNWLSNHEIEVISVVEDYFNIKMYKRLIIDLHNLDNILKDNSRKQGYEKAREQGKVGRPKSDNLTEALRLYDTRKLTIEQISKMTSISESTIYRAIRDRRAKINISSCS
jgi:DNA invertase Pin-like site-specific DNA recombinase